MLKTEQNVSFAGAWRNFQMNRVLDSALKSREPIITRWGKGYSVKPNTPFREFQNTKRVAEEVDKFVKAKPNKKSFQIAEKIAKAFPLIKSGLLIKSTGKKIIKISADLQKTLEDLAEIRKNLHNKLTTFIAGKNN